ncbi:hypothetical protein [Bradyrhizobium sp. th.b2]|uniref:hypothetical protein n=1 Tax=Bradyrhizobium sp. th-b2 TaxID=172088 RepID=UPI0003FE8F63|nr:hypothetical protein [Bradyrhizobium sp. th.b2]
MSYQVLNDDGEALDAHLDIEGNEIIFHSRGGKRGQASARNLDYGPALRLLLARLARAGTKIEGAWLDSDEVLHLPQDQRSLLSEQDLVAAPLIQFQFMSRRMQKFGRATDAAYGGSRVKKLRIRIEHLAPSTELTSILGVKAVLVSRITKSLPTNEFEEVDAEHIWLAVQHLRKMPQESTFAVVGEYELIVDDELRLNPEVVFKLAVNEAQNSTARSSWLFSKTTRQIHGILKNAGFAIVRRGAHLGNEAIPISEGDRAWAEGRPKLILHLKRERAAGLARAKKQSFLRKHGRLLCERCGLDPILAFGSAAGEACIEVHHKRVHIRQMSIGHQTSLDDVECLCANCHRVVHALLKPK